MPVTRRCLGLFALGLSVGLIGPAAADESAAIFKIPTGDPNVHQICLGLPGVTIPRCDRQIDETSGTVTALPSILSGIAISRGNVTGGLTNVVSMASLNAHMYGWGPTAGGLAIQSQLHPDYGVVESTLPYNETEFQVYTDAANGIAQTVWRTDQVVLQSGTPFSPSWVGVPFFYFEGVAYKVMAVTDAKHLTVSTPSGGAVSFASTVNGTYYFGGVSATNTCQVSGNTVTTSPGAGTPFFGASDETLFVNGTRYSGTVSGGYSNSTLTLSDDTLGHIADATCVLWGHIDHQLAALRVQGLQGANEEQFTVSLHADGTYVGTQYAGSGKFRPLYFTNGEKPAGTKDIAIALTPGAAIGQGGVISLGGLPGRELLALNEATGLATFNGSTPVIARSDSQELRFNGLGLLSWRLISTVNDKAPGSLIVQYSADNFGADLHNAATFNANGTLSPTGGVSCAGAPTASFAVTNGIVTHC